MSLDRLSWHLQSNTFSEAERRRYADQAADDASPLRRLGYQVFNSLPRDAALALAARFDAFTPVAEGTLRHYRTEDVLRVEELRHVAMSPAIMMAAACWIGAPPVVMDVSVWRSGVNTGAPELPQDWHRDYDDWRACKLFMMLSDVTADTGPHQFIAGSHRHDWFAARDLPSERYFVGTGRGGDVQREVDALPAVTFTGEAGMVWLECTNGFHRGMPPRTGERLVFQVLYSLTEWPGLDSKRGLIRAAWGV